MDGVRSRRLTDDDRRDNAEYAFPDVFGASKVIFAKAIEGSNHAASYRQTNRQTTRYSSPHLLPELLVDCLVGLRSKSLLKECQENRDNDAGL